MVVIYGYMMGYIYINIYILVGGIPTPLKNDGLRQLGRLFNSQLNGKS